MKRLFTLFICFGLSTVIYSNEEISTEEKYFSQIAQHLEQKNWDNAYHICHLMYKKYPHFEKTYDVYYQWGVSAFHLKHYSKANECFSKYLELTPNPEYFEEIIQFKFLIAEAFRKGEKSHLFGWNAMPKWMPSSDQALEIYEEIIASLPHHELAVRSLYGKALLLAYYEDYRDSIDTFNLLIQRFPKHNLAPQSFVEIGKVYLQMAKSKQQDPTLIDQSAINIRKFRMAFPSNKNIVRAEKVHKRLQSAFADNLYDIALFYKKRKKHKAAELYFKKILSTFPESKSAYKASRDLETLVIDENVL